MKLGNLIRDQKNQLNQNKKKVALIKKDRQQDNHVIAIKNKLYDNSALDESTQRSSFQAGQPGYMSNSMIAVDKEMTKDQPRYRTDSAAQKAGVFQIKKQHPNFMMDRNPSSDRIRNQGQNNTFLQYKSFQGEVPNIMTEVDFAGRYKDKITNQWPRTNMPHMKRIINN